MAAEAKLIDAAAANREPHYEPCGWLHWPEHPWMSSLCAYFVRTPFAVPRQPVLICMGGLDSIKDEMWFMQGHGVHTRHDDEVPVGRCIDYLAGRPDVDPARIAVCGSSLGGYEHRLAACMSHGAIWSIQDPWAGVGDMRCPYRGYA